MKHILHILVVLMICLLFPPTATLKSCLPCQCHEDTQFGGLQVVCTNLSLPYLPLPLPEETTTLLLNRNKLSLLPESAFISMGNLKHLDLSRNFLQWLDDNVFHGIHKLESLNLDYNQILSHCDGIFQPLFLSPLKNLLKLSILSQHRSCFIISNKYMYFADYFPPSLRELYIDCWPCFFSSSFSLLTNLTRLWFSSENVHGNCYINSLNQSTFSFFPHLESLNISDCQVLSIHPSTFLPLKSLTTLDMSVYLFGGGGFDAFMNATMSLQNSQIKLIRFKNEKNVEVDENIFRFISNTSLRELHLNSDLRALVRDTVFKQLPSTLEVLVFHYFQYINLKPFNALQSHHSLRKLDMSGLAFPEDYTSQCTFDMIPPKVTTFICVDCKCPIFFGVSNRTGLAPNVENKSVRKLVVTGNKIEYVQSVITKAYTLEYLDLRDNDLKIIYPDFFPPNNTVSFLNLAVNRLANFFEEGYQKLFTRLTKLKFLDISENGIYFLPMDTFQFSPEIRLINVSNNHLQAVELRLSSLIKLETLDISDNKLHDLALGTTEDIDSLPYAKVHLSGNPLVCGCEELNFLRWVKRNPQRVQDRSSLKCRLTTGQYNSFDNLDRIINNLEELCKSRVLEISVSVSIAVCALVTLIGFLGYRNRWKLRYHYHVGRRGYRRRYEINDDKENAYHYDAFVSYADEDRRFVIDAMIPELEERCGLKLCIHHRDFLPGEVIAANIVNAIQNSHKTLIILSPAFLRSNWCEFEYNMARMEGVSRRQEVVLVVLYEDVPMEDLPKDMAMMLRRNCYIEYNNDVFDNEVFWYNVLESIKINRPVD